MKGFGVLGIGIVAALIVLGVAAYMLGWMELGAIAACQNIYAYFPSFRCCDEVLDYQGSKTLYFQPFIKDGRQVYQCPATMNRCEVLLSNADLTFGSKVMVGTSNCRWGGIVGETWICDDDQEMTIGSWVSIPNGAWVHLIGPTSIKIDYKHYRLKLGECGAAACGSTAPTVLGSDGCGFNTNADIYDSSGRIKIGANPQDFYAYTVPFKECYTFFPDTNRRVIGDTCEECSTTNDCATRYGNTYNYLGTDYGAVCGGGHVQLYDCMASGSNVCTKVRYDANGIEIGCDEYGQGSKCDLYLAIPIQCCPGDSSCGAQSFCDTDYTCKQTTQCQTDPDCGHTIMCDYTTNELKTPICQNGQCTFSTQTVECCGDGNCPAGYYCDASYKCKEKTAAKTTCVFECCVNEQQYFDRPCAFGMTCCSDRTCQASCDGVPPEPNYLWLIVPILLACFALIGYLTKGILGGIIGAIIGGLGGYLVFWWMSLAWWAQLLLTFGLAGLGVVGLYLFGGIIATIGIAIFWMVMDR